jgi:hypothetical protein
VTDGIEQLVLPVEVDDEPEPELEEVLAGGELVVRVVPVGPVVEVEVAPMVGAAIATTDPAESRSAAAVLVTSARREWILVDIVVLPVEKPSPLAPGGARRSQARNGSPRRQ